MEDVGESVDNLTYEPSPTVRVPNGEIQKPQGSHPASVSMQPHIRAVPYVWLALQTFKEDP